MSTNKQFSANSSYFPLGTRATFIEFPQTQSINCKVTTVKTQEIKNASLFGYDYSGGKTDDVTVVLGYVV